MIDVNTDDEAQARLGECRQHVDIECALALFGGWSGVDVSILDPDATLEHVQIEASHSTPPPFTTLSPGRTWTGRDLAEFVAEGGLGPVFVGSPTAVVDDLERWREESASMASTSRWPRGRPISSASTTS